MFQSTDTIGLHTSWALRNDGHYLLLYKVSPVEAKNWVLEPVQSYVVCLIDGASTYQDTIEAIRSIFPLGGTDEAKKFLDHHLEILNSQDDIVVANSPSIRKFRAADYFIPASKYALPGNSRLSLPTKIGLFLTERCCTDCIYCYADRRRVSPDRLLSRDVWRGLIDEALDKVIYNLDVLGGDPLADATAFETTCYLVKRGVPTYLSTKCEITTELGERLLHEGFLDSTVAGSHTLQLSVDSVRPEVADQLTQTTGFLDRIHRSIAACHSLGIRPKLKTVVCALNWSEVEDIIQHFSALGINEFQFVQYGISHFKFRPDLYLSAEQKLHLQSLSTSLPARYGDLHIQVQDDVPSKPPSFNECLKDWKSRARCTGGYSSMVVTSTGAVLPCEQLPREPAFVVGDVLDGGIERAWADERIERFLFPDRSRFAGTVCEKCLEFDDCHLGAGFCYRDSFLAYETVYEAPPSCPWQARRGHRLV